jgi:pSer/pThr/pTyr-binding forkhead associated (FHA) protein
VLVPQGALAGQPDIPLKRAVTTVGSSETCRLVLQSRTISRNHAVFLVDGPSTYLADLASRTGVLVNGKPIREVELKAGDRIQVGKFVFRYRSADGLAPDPAPAAPAVAAVVAGLLSVPLPGRVALIGRKETSDVALVGDSAVSAAHAALFHAGGQWYVRDLGSRTGTTVNGDSVIQQAVNVGDRIGVGAATIQFEPVAAVAGHATVDLTPTVGLTPPAPLPTPAGSIPLSVDFDADEPVADATSASAAPSVPFGVVAATDHPVAAILSAPEVPVHFADDLPLGDAAEPILSEPAADAAEVAPGDAFAGADLPVEPAPLPQPRAWHAVGVSEPALDAVAPAFEAHATPPEPQPRSWDEPTAVVTTDVAEPIALAGHGVTDLLPVEPDPIPADMAEASAEELTAAEPGHVIAALLPTEPQAPAQPVQDVASPAHQPAPSDELDALVAEPFQTEPSQGEPAGLEWAEPTAADHQVSEPASVEAAPPATAEAVPEAWDAAVDPVPEPTVPAADVVEPSPDSALAWEASVAAEEEPAAAVPDADVHPDLSDSQFGRPVDGYVAADTTGPLVETPADAGAPDAHLGLPSAELVEPAPSTPAAAVVPAALLADLSDFVFVPGEVDENVDIIFWGDPDLDAAAEAAIVSLPPVAPAAAVAAPPTDVAEPFAEPASAAVTDLAADDVTPVDAASHDVAPPVESTAVVNVDEPNLGAAVSDDLPTDVTAVTEPSEEAGPLSSDAADTLAAGPFTAEPSIDLRGVADDESVLPADALPAGDGEELPAAEAAPAADAFLPAVPAAGTPVDVPAMTCVATDGVDPSLAVMPIDEHPTTAVPPVDPIAFDDLLAGPGTVDGADHTTAAGLPDETDELPTAVVATDEPVGFDLDVEWGQAEPEAAVGLDSLDLLDAAPEPTAEHEPSGFELNAESDHESAEGLDALDLLDAAPARTAEHEPSGFELNAESGDEAADGLDGLDLLDAASAPTAEPAAAGGSALPSEPTDLEDDLGLLDLTPEPPAGHAGFEPVAAEHAFADVPTDEPIGFDLHEDEASIDTIAAGAAHGFGAVVNVGDGLVAGVLGAEALAPVTDFSAEAGGAAVEAFEPVTDAALNEPPVEPSPAGDDVAFLDFQVDDATAAAMVGDDGEAGLSGAPTPSPADAVAELSDESLPVEPPAFVETVTEPTVDVAPPEPPLQLLAAAKIPLPPLDQMGPPDEVLTDEALTDGAELDGPVEPEGTAGLTDDAPLTDGAEQVHGAVLPDELPAMPAKSAGPGMSGPSLFGFNFEGGSFLGGMPLPLRSPVGTPPPPAGIVFDRQTPGADPIPEGEPTDEVGHDAIGHESSDEAAEAVSEDEVDDGPAHSGPPPVRPVAPMGPVGLIGLVGGSVALPAPSVVAPVGLGNGAHRTIPPPPVPPQGFGDLARSRGRSGDVFSQASGPIGVVEAFAGRPGRADQYHIPEVDRSASATPALGDRGEPAIAVQRPPAQRLANNERLVPVDLPKRKKVRWLVLAGVTLPVAWAGLVYMFGAKTATAVGTLRYDGLDRQGESARRLFRGEQIKLLCGEDVRSMARETLAREGKPAGPTESGEAMDRALQSEDLKYNWDQKDPNLLTVAFKATDADVTKAQVEALLSALRVKDEAMSDTRARAAQDLAAATAATAAAKATDDQLKDDRREQVRQAEDRPDRATVDDLDRAVDAANKRVADIQQERSGTESVLEGWKKQDPTKPVDPAIDPEATNLQRRLVPIQAQIAKANQLKQLNGGTAGGGDDDPLMGMLQQQADKLKTQLDHRLLELQQASSTPPEERVRQRETAIEQLGVKLAAAKRSEAEAVAAAATAKSAADAAHAKVEAARIAENRAADLYTKLSDADLALHDASTAQDEKQRALDAAVVVAGSASTNPDVTVPDALKSDPRLMTAGVGAMLIFVGIVIWLLSVAGTGEDVEAFGRGVPPEGRRADDDEPANAAEEHETVGV